MKKYLFSKIILVVVCGLMPIVAILFNSCSVIQGGIDGYNKFAFRTNLENKGFPINSGDNPPNVEGTFVISIAKIEYNSDGRFKAPDVFADMYITFTYKKDSKGKDIITYSEVCGDGTLKCEDVSLTGEGDMFTASMRTDGYFNQEKKRYYVFISGEKVNDGIKNIRYGIVIEDAITEKYKAKEKNDKGVEKEVEKTRKIDVYRIIKDADELSESKTVIDAREKKLAAVRAEQERLATIEKQKQDSIATVKKAERERQAEAERQEQARREAESERQEQIRINNLITATKPLIGTWKGSYKYNNNDYEYIAIITFIDYNTVRWREETKVKGSYITRFPATEDTYYYSYTKPNIEFAGKRFVLNSGIITFISNSGVKVTLKKVN